MKILSIAAALVLASACVDEGSDSDKVDETPVAPDKAQDPPTIVEPPLERRQLANEDDCNVVPDPAEPDGPCAYACDPEGLKQFVPEGSCITFKCHDAAGEEIKVGACQP